LKHAWQFERQDVFYARRKLAVTARNLTEEIKKLAMGQL
jgi:hypothetical protein